MRGRILSYDGATGTGFIVGSSGVRYSFSKADLRRLARLEEDSTVEFHPDDDVRDRRLAMRLAAGAVQSPSGSRSLNRSLFPNGSVSDMLRPQGRFSRPGRRLG